jgi:hypothetical protein
MHLQKYLDASITCADQRIRPGEPNNFKDLPKIGAPGSAAAKEIQSRSPLGNIWGNVPQISRRLRSELVLAVDYSVHPR